jgi:hypothetical protein
MTAVRSAELVLLLELVLGLHVQPVALLLLLDEREELIFGLPQLRVGASAEAVELLKVDLADSPRVSAVWLLTGRVASRLLLYYWWHLVSSVSRLSEIGVRRAGSAAAAEPTHLIHPTGFEFSPV